MATTAPLTAFAEALRATRREAGMTQIALAEATGFGQASVSAWESGHVIPTAPAVAAIARALPARTLDDWIGLLGQGAG